MASKESIWGSSRLPAAQLTRTRQPSATHIRVGGNEQGRWVRPPSAIHPPTTDTARPDSNQLSRPKTISCLDSRPSSRLDSRPASRQNIIERPKSGRVRPLSGKVFMRRTADHGWIAKAYTIGSTDDHSKPHLNLFEDLSDCESLDSFFDDDFDTQTSEQKLGNILSCNTLGVDSKAKRPDWVSGTFELPEFHCPRCRDHWYGLTDVPCDEELARLIREGLWYTGKGGGDKTDREAHNRRLRKGNEDGEYKSHSSTSLSLTASSRTRVDKDVESSTKLQTSEHAKKSKRQITFKLDNDNKTESSDVSNSQLGGYGDRRREKGSGNVIQEREKSLKDDQSGSPISSMKNGMGSRREGSADGGWSGTETQESWSRGGVSGKKDQRMHNNVSDSLSEDSEGSGLFDGGVRRSKKKLNEKLVTTQSALSGSGRLTKTETESSVGVGSMLSGSTKSRVTVRAHEAEERDRIGGNDDDTNSNSMAQVSLSTGSREENKDSSFNSSAQVQQTGSRRGYLGLEDHGKKVRKAGGHMRAVSPNSSNWGDPTHARLFISSTATSRTVSRCGSAVSLHSEQTGDTCTDIDTENEGHVTLPPIVPAITNKKPLVDMLDMFQFTRAWTFSYHN